ncbi:hypothetical protein M378DRAFT_167750 [Amanita muscaria Koide BX008]|uniref:Uncharacterized protein n=1 Tax=Amanita muscaria (strain Koide BX008) TaxID=946122 RepID=A0A0C2WH18_AMAMK|nr:hypothetical protein M378DRAFT_167750 [Amanita muscaria Koide BX008]
MTQDSTFSDLHRLPSSLLDDSLDSQSVRFNTAPSTPTLLLCVSPPSLSTSFASESSPSFGFTNTTHIFHPTIAISRSNTPSPTGTSTPTHPTSPLSLSPPRSISPPRHPIRPLPQLPKSSIRSFPSLSPLNLTPAPSTGIELILDPVESPFDTSVSPIVFASSDSDDYSFERYPGDFTDDDSVEIVSWGGQDGTEPLLEREEVGTMGRGDKNADVEAKRKQRMKENSGWSSVRVPLRKKSSGLERGGETPTWVGEWNSDMHNVIQQLRTLR